MSADVEKRHPLKTCVFAYALALLVTLTSGAAGAEADGQRFRACKNTQGAGMFWADTTTGQVWWADPSRFEWVYYGRPAGAVPGAPGRFLPVANESGAGLFVVCPESGEGWWTDGKVWKVLGVPMAPAVDGGVSMQSGLQADG